MKELLKDETERKPLSENLSIHSTKNFCVTAAIWRSCHEFSLDAYEIGIRDLRTGGFTLIQSHSFNSRNVTQVARAISLILESGYEELTPKWCQTIFGSID